MRKFVLRINQEAEEAYEESFYSTRKHQTVLTNVPSSFNQVSTILSHFDISLTKELRILTNLRNHKNINGAHLLKLLSRMPLLTKAMLSFRSSLEPDYSAFELTKFPRLQKLSFYSGDKHFIRHIEARNLVKLRCSQLDIDHLIEFLRHCTKLQKLRLCLQENAKFFEPGRIDELNLKLTKFNLTGHAENFVSDNFLRFLTSQAASLTSLRLDIHEVVPVKKIFEMLHKLKRLEKLIISIRPGTSESYEGMKPLVSLKYLEVYLFKEENDNFIHEFIRQCPSLQQLRCGNYANIFNTIARYNRKLDELVIDQMSQLITGDLMFTNLKTLKFYYETDGNFMISLLNRCPKIEEVAMFASTPDAIDTLVQYPTLRHLIIIARVEKIARIFERIKISYGNLKTLEFVFFLGVLKYERVKIEFPEDNSLWTEQYASEKLSNVVPMSLFEYRDSYKIHRLSKT